MRYAKRNGLVADDEVQADGHTIVTVRGARAYELFAGESGGHCVQRVPDSERSGRRHTSMVSVAVLPIEEADKGGDDGSFREADVEFIFQRGHGKGGQHRNKTESSVRARHLPTGLSVFINQGRDQHQNRRAALEILRAKVGSLRAAEREAIAKGERRRLMGTGGRAEKIRTYNFIYSLVVDHKTGRRTTQVDDLMGGRFDLLA